MVVTRNKHIGPIIKMVRTAAGLKQIELANIADVSHSYISLLEQGKRDPNITTVKRIFDSLGFNLVLAMFLLEGTDMHDQTLNEKMSYAIWINLKEIERLHGNTEESLEDVRPGIEG